jgi:hypothetical protein
MSNDRAFVNVIEVRKRLGDSTIVDRISLEVCDDEIPGASRLPS